MADDYGYLSGLSAHPNRAGDTSNLNPAFATALANAIRQARAAGLNVGIESGFRAPTQTGSAYDAGGNSSHSYGLAADISGLGSANSAAVQQWQKIAEANGLHNPYGINDAAEFNHWQLPEQPLEQNPKLLASLKTASATGDINNVWSAYNSGGGPSRVGTATPIPGGGSHADFIRSYAQSIGLDPNLALGIANAEGLRAWWTGNPNAASRVDIDPKTGQPFSFGDFQLNIHPGAMGSAALAANIDPRDPNQWQAADKFALDQMKAKGVSAWSGDPVAKAYLATGKVPPAPTMPGTTINAAGGPPVTAGGPGATPATGQPAPGPGGWAGQLATALKPLTPGGKGGAGGGDGGDQPQPMQLPMAPPAQAAGGPMMLGPGGQNVMGQRTAQNALAQQGFMMQPTLAANTLGATRPPVPTMMPGQATGIPGLPGTTLNSPSQLQMALMTGAMSPYDLYANNAAQQGGGFPTGSY